MKLDAISIGQNPPNEVNVIIEIPRGGEPVKYELDKSSGALVVDRFLQTSMRYPCNYGFIPHTCSDDGDPIDALVLGSHPVIPGAIIRSRPIGVLMMKDEAGVDEKLLMVPSGALTPLYDKVVSHRDIPRPLLEEIEHFFIHYKDLEKGKWVETLGWEDVTTAQTLIEKAIQKPK